ncbi:unnamed protein product [Dibothriocephalus latus]|uniref:Uncharacterized protein n=1 Tax=Dibothriocephalus latus TaxID=60516 RepID=A0A3P7R7P9_DIBLA|nr:unnamed protein product [Dibothriocephalus latus]
MEAGFFIVGTRESVEKARVLITFEIYRIFDLERLEAEKIDPSELSQQEPRQTNSEPLESASFQGGGGDRNMSNPDGECGSHSQLAGEGSDDLGGELAAGPQGNERDQSPRTHV